MGFQDALNYVLFTNPVSSNTLWLAKVAANSVTNSVGLQSKNVQATRQIVHQQTIYQLARQTGPFVRLAAISGAMAVMLGAYGSHRKYASEESQEVFNTASRYHLIHSVALLGLPMCRFPYLTGTFMLSGILLFCGTCYYYAFTQSLSYRKLTPYGGTCLILAWLSMIF